MSHKTVYTYDWADDLLSVREFNSSTSYYLTTYSYDKSQNLLSITDAKNNVTSYKYNGYQQSNSYDVPRHDDSEPVIRRRRKRGRKGSIQTET